MLKRLKTSKAAWTALGGAVAAIGAATQGLIPWEEAGPIVWAAIVLVFLRDGVAKLE